MFDAQNPPPGLPRQVTHRGITVLYASQYDNADECWRKKSTPFGAAAVYRRVERSPSAPRRAATKAQAIDSDQWYAMIVRRRQERQQASPPAAMKPEGPLTPGEVEYWLGVFDQ